MKKAAHYARIYRQLAGLLPGCNDLQARMSTICAVLHHKMPLFFWTGFYMLAGDRLIVKGYQGPLACMELPAGQGVCWSAILAGKTIIVADVHAFAGHIACDSRSRSEIAVPVQTADGNIAGVLDIDSMSLDAFDQTDAIWLEKILALVVQA